MVNSGKRKYTKKTIMSGGEIEFLLIPPPKKNTQRIAPASQTKKENDILYFIDGTQDTFYNTLINVYSSKSYSKCYLENEGGRNVPYQLIYNNVNNSVYQFTAIDFRISRFVHQK